MRDSIGRTFAVAGALCLGCSLLVSTAAVVLRDTQLKNKKLDIQANILNVAGIYEEGDDVDSVFRNRVETYLVDLKSGLSLNIDNLDDENREISDFERQARVDKLDIANYDPRKAAKNPALNVEAEGLNQISRREPMAFVYFIKGANAKKGDPFTQIVLPMYGKGLWSTLYGFIALEPDTVTVRGITFYEHGETPGLGGEVDNEAWKASWQGKKVFDLNHGADVKLGVVKNASGEFEVDALSGATITSNGVTNLVSYWLGLNAFGEFLKLKRAEIKSDGTTAANLNSNSAISDSGAAKNQSNNSGSEKESGGG